MLGRPSKRRGKINAALLSLWDRRIELAVLNRRVGTRVELRDSTSTAST
jgi:hypothetical protein